MSMGKGRKLTTSRSESYFGSMIIRGQARGTPPDDLSELEENDVWSTVHDDNRDEWDERATARGRSHTPRASGLSLAFEGPTDNSSQGIGHQFRPEPPSELHVAASAPMDVPDWSKMYRTESSLPEWDNGSDDSVVVPPHEYLARSRGMAANSVFEGVGRTLKGRDLSRVRDAVWSQTGFDG